MNRRTILKNLTLISGGALVLPSCDFFEEKAVTSMNNLQITEKQQTLLAEIVGELIPDGEIPGARELKVQNFVWVMLDDCMEKHDQERFINGLDQFNGYSRKVTGKVFEKLTQDKQIQLLQNILSHSNNGTVPVKSQPNNMDDVLYSLQTIKQITIQGYLYSKHIMTEIMPYALIPGSYDACKTIDTSKRINIHG